MCVVLELTSAALGVILDVLTFFDELVLGGGASKASLSGSAELRGEARGVTGNLSGGRHGELMLFR